MAARKRPPVGKPWTPDKVRDRIKGTLIAEKLQNHVLKGTEMTSSQVTAGLALLRKVVPDLSSTELVASIISNRAEELSDAELASVLKDDRSEADEAGATLQ